MSEVNREYKCKHGKYSGCKKCKEAIDALPLFTRVQQADAYRAGYEAAREQAAKLVETEASFANNTAASKLRLGCAIDAIRAMQPEAK